MFLREWGSVYEYTQIKNKILSNIHTILFLSKSDSAFLYELHSEGD